MPADDGAGRLAGVHVLITRPDRQAGALRGMVEREGGSASLIPMLEITGPSHPEALTALLERLRDFDIAIFVSVNAVDAVCDRLTPPWPAGIRVAAVGRGTAEALARRGLHAGIHPVRDFSSEGLLAEAALEDVAGLRIVVFRGEGGREWLAESLRARGAEVHHAEVYRRRLPAGAAPALERLIGARAVDIIVVTSNEGLLNLHDCAGDRHHHWLLARQLAVIGERTAALAATLGFERPARVAGEASDQGLLEAIVQITADKQAAISP